MIQKLKYKTKEGNKMEMTNCPIDMGIEMLFITLNDAEKEKVLKELQDKS